jgi:hypothetical protein
LASTDFGSAIVCVIFVGAQRHKFHNEPTKVYAESNTVVISSPSSPVFYVKRITVLRAVERRL